jgi:hypothetical protein
VAGLRPASCSCGDEGAQAVRRPAARDPQTDLPLAAMEPGVGAPGLRNGSRPIPSRSAGAVTRRLVIPCARADRARRLQCQSAFFEKVRFPRCYRSRGQPASRPSEPEGPHAPGSVAGSALAGRPRPSARRSGRAPLGLASGGARTGPSHGAHETPGAADGWSTRSRSRRDEFRLPRNRAGRAARSDRRSRLDIAARHLARPIAGLAAADGTAATTNARPRPEAPAGWRIDARLPAVVTGHERAADMAAGTCAEGGHPISTGPSGAAVTEARRVRASFSRSYSKHPLSRLASPPEPALKRVDMGKLGLGGVGRGRPTRPRRGGRKAAGPVFDRPIEASATPRRVRAGEPGPGAARVGGPGPPGPCLRPPEDRATAARHRVASGLSGLGSEGLCLVVRHHAGCRCTASEPAREPCAAATGPGPVLGIRGSAVCRAACSNRRSAPGQA